MCDVCSDCRLRGNLPRWGSTLGEELSRGENRAMYVSESQSPGLGPKYAVGKGRVLTVCVREVCVGVRGGG